MPERLSRLRLTEHAYDYLKNQLFDIGRRQGSKLRVEDLVDELGMSRHPIMEALKRLEQERFVEIIPQVGVFVVTADKREISDFFRFFASTESYTAEFAAARATVSDLRALRAISRQIAAVRDDCDMAMFERGKAYRLLNRDLHRAIHAMAQSPTIGAVAESLWDRVDFYIAGAPGGKRVYTARIPAAHAEHESIIEAISAGNIDRARTEMEAHVLAFGQSYWSQHADAAPAEGTTQ